MLNRCLLLLALVGCVYSTYTELDVSTLTYTISNNQSNPNYYNFNVNYTTGDVIVIKLINAGKFVNTVGVANWTFVDTFSQGGSRSNQNPIFVCSANPPASIASTGSGTDFCKFTNDTTWWIILDTASTPASVGTVAFSFAFSAPTQLNFPDINQITTTKGLFVVVNNDSNVNYGNFIFTSALSVVGREDTAAQSSFNFVSGLVLASAVVTPKWYIFAPSTGATFDIPATISAPLASLPAFVNLTSPSKATNGALRITGGSTLPGVFGNYTLQLGVDTEGLTLLLPASNDLLVYVPTWTNFKFIIPARTLANPPAINTVGNCDGGYYYATLPFNLNNPFTASISSTTMKSPPNPTIPVYGPSAGYTTGAYSFYLYCTPGTGTFGLTEVPAVNGDQTSTVSAGNLVVTITNLNANTWFKFSSGSSVTCLVSCALFRSDFGPRYYTLPSGGPFRFLLQNSGFSVTWTNGTFVDFAAGALVLTVPSTVETIGRVQPVVPSPQIWSLYTNIEGGRYANDVDISASGLNTDSNSYRTVSLFTGGTGVYWATAGPAYFFINQLTRNFTLRTFAPTPAPTTSAMVFTSPSCMSVAPPAVPLFRYSQVSTSAIGNAVVSSVTINTVSSESFTIGQFPEFSTGEEYVSTQKTFYFCNFGPSSDTTPYPVTFLHLYGEDKTARSPQPPAVKNELPIAGKSDTAKYVTTRNYVYCNGGTAPGTPVKLTFTSFVNNATTETPLTGSLEPFLFRQDSYTDSSLPTLPFGLLLPSNYYSNNVYVMKASCPGLADSYPVIVTRFLTTNGPAADGTQSYSQYQLLKPANIYVPGTQNIYMTLSVSFGTLPSFTGLSFVQNTNDYSTTPIGVPALPGWKPVPGLAFNVTGTGASGSLGTNYLSYTFPLANPDYFLVFLDTSRNPPVFMDAWSSCPVMQRFYNVVPASNGNPGSTTIHVCHLTTFAYFQRNGTTPNFNNPGPFDKISGMSYNTPSTVLIAALVAAFLFIFKH